jgi:hypothetical protein
VNYALIRQNREKCLTVNDIIGFINLLKLLRSLFISLLNNKVSITLSIVRRVIINIIQFVGFECAPIFLEYFFHKKSSVASNLQMKTRLNIFFHSKLYSFEISYHLCFTFISFKLKLLSILTFDS